MLTKKYNGRVLPIIFRIAKIEKNIKMFEEKLAEPNLYSENPDLFHKCSAELEKLNALRDQKEEEWLELEILKEEANNVPNIEWLTLIVAYVTFHE